MRDILHRATGPDAGPNDHAATCESDGCGREQCKLHCGGQREPVTYGAMASASERKWGCVCKYPRSDVHNADVDGGDPRTEWKSVSSSVHELAGERHFERSHPDGYHSACDH